jgi:hypothetical protein
MTRKITLNAIAFELNTIARIGPITGISAIASGTRLRSGSTPAPPRPVGVMMIRLK